MRGGTGAAEGPEHSRRSEETAEKAAPSLEGEARPEAGGTGRGQEATAHTGGDVTCGTQSPFSSLSL